LGASGPADRVSRRVFGACLSGSSTDRTTYFHLSRTNRRGAA